MTTPSALILGCAGTVLTPAEKSFFRDVMPWGFILFRRNIDSPDQARALVDDLKATTGGRAIVFIDQEGGRVARLEPPHWPVRPPGSAYGRLYETDQALGLQAAELGAWLIGHDLRQLGIEADCLPVLDVPVEGADPIIGDRALGTDARTITALAGAQRRGLARAGVHPVIKHIPGHGRANVDSHLALPRVETGRATLEATDFVPFCDHADAVMAMTAHIVYAEFDADATATHSPRVIREVIRGHIGFEGLLMSDDLSMKALGGDYADRAARAFRAGCDIVLHCNGDMDEMQALAGVAPRLSGDAARRAARVKRLPHQPPATDAERDFANLMERVWSPGDQDAAIS